MSLQKEFLLDVAASQSQQNYNDTPLNYSFSHEFPSRIHATKVFPLQKYQSAWYLVDEWVLAWKEEKLMQCVPS